MSIESVKKYIDELIAELKIPYFEISVCKGYEKIFEHTIKPDEDKGKDTLYMYSCTKPLTVSLVMRLIEEGKLTLDDKLVDYIPEFSESYYLDEAGEKHIAGHEITIGHLLSMRSGLNYDLKTPAILELHEKVDNPTTLEIVKAIAKTPLMFRPGEKFQYGLSHDVLAAVIELITGERYGEYAKRMVFEPLGMTDSRFHDGEDKSRIMPFYRIDKGVFYPLPLANTLVNSNNYDSGGAGLVSTVEDYLEFAKLLANGGVSENGYRLLAPESIKLMQTGSNEQLDVKSEYTSVHGKDYIYGLGVRVRNADAPWGLLRGEFGWDGAAGSYLMVDPTKNVSIVMGMHLLGWPQIFAGKQLQIIKEIYTEFNL